MPSYLAAAMSSLGLGGLGLLVPLVAGVCVMGMVVWVAAVAGVMGMEVPLVAAGATEREGVERGVVEE